jgi:hypothetical protein
MHLSCQTEGHKIDYFAKKNGKKIECTVAVLTFEGLYIFRIFKFSIFFSILILVPSWGSHLLPGQDLDVISILFQVYFIQATTTR